MLAALERIVRGARPRAGAPGAQTVAGRDHDPATKLTARFSARAGVPEPGAGTLRQA